MARKKKNDTPAALNVENEKLAGEIEKAKQKILFAKNKIKENEERIKAEHLTKIYEFGFSLSDIVTLTEAMSKKNYTIDDMLSLIGCDREEHLDITDAEAKANCVSQLISGSEEVVSEKEIIPAAPIVTE